MTGSITRIADRCSLNKRRRAILQRGAAAAALVCSPWARAQAGFPNRPVRFYVGASAGGAPDTAARLLGKYLSEVWGQAVVVDNRPGISGLLAVDVTAKAPPDGYTLCVLLDSVINTVPFLATDKLAVDPLNDLRPISIIGGFPLVLVASPGTRYRGLQDLAADARARSGKIDYASSGVGSSGHLAMETFARRAGVQMNHVPYKGGIPALTDVAAGHVPLLWGSPTACLPLIQAGKVVALASGSVERSPLMPGIATAAEQGFVDFTAGNWIGVLGPKSLPDPLVRRLHEDIAKAADNTAFRESLLSQGIEARTASIADFTLQVRNEYDRNKTLFAELGLIAR